MNPIIMQMRMELATAKKDLSEKNIKIKRLIYEIQEKCNPYFTDYEMLQAEDIEQAADELLSAKTEAVELNTKIKKLEKELNG